MLKYRGKTADNWLWVGIISAPILALTWGLIFFTLPVMIMIVTGILFIFGIKAGRERALGVGVFGAVAAAVLIPPSGMGLPFFAGIAGGAGWLVVFAISSRRQLKFSSVFALFAAPTFIGIVAALLAPETPLLAILVALFTLMVGFVAGSPLNERDKQVIRVGLIVMACAEATLLIYETFILKGWMFGDSQGWAHPVMQGTYRAAGTVGHPIAAGAVLLVAIGLLSAARWRVGRGKVLILAVLLAGVFATGSMSVYITTGVCLLAPYAAKRSIPSHFVKAFLGVLGVIYVTTDQLVLAYLTDGIGALNSGHRINTLLAVPRLIFARPLGEAAFGSGWGTAEQNYVAGYFINDNFFAPDNQFVTVLMAAGLIGLLLFTAFLVQAWRKRSRQSWVPFVALVMMFLSFDVLSWAATGGIFVAVAIGLASRRGADESDATAAGRDDETTLPTLGPPTRPSSAAPPLQRR